MGNTVPELMAAVAREIDGCTWDIAEAVGGVGPGTREAYETMEASGELETYRRALWQSLLDSIRECRREKSWQDMTIH